MRLNGKGYSITRLVRCLIRAIFTLLAFAAAAAATAEPYFVEDVLRYQLIHAVRFTPDGAGVIIEHSDERTDSFDYRSRLLWVDMRAGEAGKPLFSQAPGEGYWMLSSSPDGRYVAYLHYHGNLSKAAVYDLKSGRNTEFDVVPTDDPYWTWISGHEIVLATMSPRTSRSSFTEQMSLEWRKMQEGRSTTASAVGSGRYAAKWEDDRDEGIVIADIGTGAVRLLGQGRFLDEAASPGAARLAAIRQLPAVSNPRLPIADDTTQGPLVVFDTNLDGSRHEIGDVSDALPGSLRWSPSGRRLAFLRAAGNGTGERPQLWTYDTVNGTTRRVDLKGLSASSDPHPNGVLLQSDVWLPRPTTFAWLGEDLTVLARATAAPNHTARANWFLLRPEAAPINLTAEFDQVPELAAITRKSLLMSADGQVWEVKVSQKPRRLAGNLDQRVRVVRDSAVRPDIANLPATSLVLEDDRPDGPKTVYFLDAASGRITDRVQAPAPDARVRAISAPFKRVAFRHREDDVDIITVGDATGASRVVSRFNEFRKNKEIGTFIKVEYPESKTGRKGISWLLLPPGYRKGLPLPTVVDIYPGTAYGSTPPQIDPNGYALLLAAHGYAVLFASLPIDKSVIPREPLEGLADSVLLAVDAAISQGYVDGDRLAIQGHSFGGYGTLGVISQTNRFRAAVSLAGFADLISVYGQPRIDDRLAGDLDGILDMMRPMGWAETGQGGLGMLPWRDPQRYLRNSPLLHVDSINTPVMLVHGDLDAAVPFTQAEEMFTALYRLNKDAVFLRYWGEGHHVPISPANIHDYWARVYSWYDHYIGPPFDVAGALSTSH